MEIKEAYNHWAHQYDTNDNKTRDAEAIALRATLDGIHFSTCLEIGCGTGKNTEWLITKTDKLVAVDFSDVMLAKAKAKIQSEKIQFIQADINEEWRFLNHTQFDLACFSLVLEHIEDLNSIFEKLSKAVKPKGYVYIGELHPFKQYNGSKARFETSNGTQVLTCFTHHISEFIHAAKQNGFVLSELNEYFDDDDQNNIPRILTLLFKNTKA